MIKLTVEEENLLCIYTDRLKDVVVKDIKDIVRSSDSVLGNVGVRLIEKIQKMSNEEFKELLGVIALTD